MARTTRTSPPAHQLEVALEHSLVPLATIDADARYRYVNNAFCRLVGYDREQLVGKSVSILTHEADRGEADQHIARMLAGEITSWRVERLLKHADGSRIPVLVHGNALHEGDVLVGGIALMQDLAMLHDSRRRLEQQAELFDELTRHASDLALITDADGRIVYASPALTTMFGHDVGTIVGTHGLAVVHPEDVPVIQAAFAQVLEGRPGDPALFRIRDSSGDWHWVRESLTNMLDTSLAGVFVNLVDVTAQVEAEQALRASEARHRAISEAAAEGICVCRVDGSLEYVNGRLSEILGIEPKQLASMTLVEVFGPEQADRILARAKRHNSSGIENYELTYDHPDGQRRILTVAASRYVTDDGNVRGTLAMMSDVTDARQAEAELRFAAVHDPLTSLPNRALIQDRIERALTRAAHSEDGSVAVLLFDVDNLNLLNESLGHEAGDRVLVEIAARMHQAARPSDTIGRLGGDEFVVVCEDVDGLQAQTVADRLLATIGRPMTVDGSPVTVSLSAGIAVSDADETATTLLRHADTAMSVAKEAGRGQAVMFDPRGAELIESRFALANALRAAFARDELVMHYQPIVDMTTGAVVGLEALARWSPPGFGDVRPEVWVDVAETIGLAHVLDAWAVRSAVTDAARLRALDLLDPDTYVSVNLSARTLGDPALETTIIDLTVSAGLPPRAVMLEITEGAVMARPKSATEQLERLRKRGFRIALDDFGTGYSSLAYLRDFPVTALKIDRAFIVDIDHDSDAGAIVTSIVELAQAVGVDAIAEGVETAEQAALLRQMGCRFGQGFLWRPALPSDGFAGGMARAGFGPTLLNPAATPRRAATPELREEHGLLRLITLQREGASLSTIAAALNSEGFHAPNGMRWHRSSVARAIAGLARSRRP